VLTNDSIGTRKVRIYVVDGDRLWGREELGWTNVCGITSDLNEGSSTPGLNI